MAALRGITPEQRRAMREAAAAVRADPSPFGFSTVALKPDTLDALLDAHDRLDELEVL